MPQWIQRQIVLAERPRGIHLITDDLLRQVPEIYDFQIGLAHFFLQHTSASLAINERVDDDVRTDLEHYLKALAPEDASYTHSYEGPDDMPAHIKSVLIGVEVTVPISNGRLSFGAWQGLYLCEHRNHGGRRRLIVTLQGELT
ncbi:MAG: secondary thiamine-phosphate synthase enzyme YjbQ [Caldilinea sp.]